MGTSFAQAWRRLPGSESAHQPLDGSAGPVKDRRAVYAQQGVEVELEQAGHAALELIEVVDHLRTQQTHLARRIADQRVADEQQAALGPEKSDLARRLARHRDDLQRAQAIAVREKVVGGDALAAGVLGVVAMDGDAGL